MTIVWITLGYTGAAALLALTLKGKTLWMPSTKHSMEDAEQMRAVRPKASAYVTERDTIATLS